MSLLFRSVCMVAGTLTTAFAAEGLRFNSPAVLDLSLRPAVAMPGRAIPFVRISAADTAAILGASEQDQRDQLGFSDILFGCSEDRACTKRHEDALIAKENGSVRRDHSRLTIVSESAQPLTFVDTTIAPTKTADGDATRHVYLGRIPGSGYHRVEVQFDHDSPGSFLVASNSGKTAFVHNGGDIVALAPTGGNIVVFNAVEMPLALVIAGLGTEPAVRLRCTAKLDVATTFRGWRDEGVDLVLTRDEKKWPVRLAHTAAGWTVAADTAALAATGFACRAAD